MTSPIGIIHSFLSATPAPTGSSLLLTGLKIVHWGWWFSLKKETYSNQPRNWVYLIGGGILDRLAGDRGPLRLAIQIYILALRTHRILEELTLLNKEISCLIDAIKGRYVPRPVIKWSTTYTPDLVKNHDKQQHKVQFDARISRIIVCAKAIFKRLFSLSNRCFHAYEGFYASTHPEILVETIEGLESLSENKERILRQIEGQKDTINYFINALQLPIKFDDVISVMRTGLEGATLVHHVMDKIGEFGGNHLSTIIKTSVTAFATFFRLDHMLPSQIHANPEKQLYLQLK